MKQLLLSAFALFATASCCERERIYDPVPYPNSLEARSGDFDMRGAAVECDAAFDAATQKAVDDFAGRLAKWTEGQETRAEKPIKFVCDSTMAHEAYRLEIKRSRIDIAASGLNGALYAIQTLRQLMPGDFYGGEPTGEWTVPCVKIDDAPRFAYRGMHMDVVRHFFPIKEVKRYLDIMAFHKLNTLHWHLTDDQGWRIEIKKYPELTTKGAYREGTVIRKNWDEPYDGIRYGGYFTREEIREVVAYAASLGITVIPEIDLPGHMLAALTAYPELGCTGGPYEVWGRWGVADDVLCAGNEKIYEFIEGVLTEVMELFPSEYIHIGGDECPKVRWEKCPKCRKKIAELGLKGDDKFTAEHYLQSYVMSRVEKFLAGHGKRVIGWDEILEGDVSPEATIMSWRGVQGGIEAAQMGHDVIMAPNSHFYFDYYQSRDVDNEPFGIGGYVPIEKVYAFDPSVKDKLTEEEAARILGVQANLWSEYIATPEHLFYMLLPRLAALSEVQWCNEPTKDRNRFMNSLPRICDLYTRMGYNFATTVFGITGSHKVNPEKSCVELTLATPGGVPIHYTTDGQDPTTASERYTAPIEIGRGCTVKAIVEREGMKTRMFAMRFADSRALGRPATLNSAPDERYRFDGAELFTDGRFGMNSYSGGEWVGFLDQPLDVTIDMGEGKKYASVTCNVLIDKESEIFPPSSVTVLSSADGKEFTRIGTTVIPALPGGEKDGIRSYTVDFPSTSARYVRVVAKTAVEIPAWHPGHGRKAWMFVDELLVN